MSPEATVELTSTEKISREIAELEAKRGLAVLEDALVKTKAEGRTRQAEEKVAAFAKASSPEEYEELIANLAPIASAEDKIALREARQNFRENHRTVADGQVEVETLNASAAQGEVG